ncbi:hypothetical protein V6Z12_D07G187500 [Gossypium hirsutum]
MWNANVSLIVYATVEMQESGQRNPYTALDEVYTLGQHICMSTHKARRIIDRIRGCSYDQTLMILELMPYRAYYPILKLFYSAAANARHNKGSNEATRGRSYLIKRPTCHITISLKDLEFESLDRYMLRPKPKNIGWLRWLKKG